MKGHNSYLVLKCLWHTHVNNLYIVNAHLQYRSHVCFPPSYVRQQDTELIAAVFDAVPAISNNNVGDLVKKKVDFKAE